MEGVIITDNLGRINVDEEPALSFTYSKDTYETMATSHSKDTYETMATVLIHNNLGYAFKYTSLKDNDFDTMTRFHASIKFQHYSNIENNAQSSTSDEYPFHPESINQYFGGQSISSLRDFNKTN